MKEEATGTGQKEQRDEALTGVKVADFTWVATGPLITQYLADHGAQVVKVESFTRPDTGRTSRPFRGGSPGLDRGGMFLCQNSSKLSLALDLGHPQGQEMARRLAAWADVVAEAFAPGVMKKWGLGYRELKKLNPSLIYLSTSLQGQTGPHAHQPGYGYHQTALSGFTYFTGRPGGEPQAPAGPYTDYVSPWLGLVAVLAALDGRRRTGRGCYIDLSQFEASLSFLREPLLDYLANGREQPRRGNASRCGAPHGIYRCQGEDRWCAIAVFSQEEWRSLCRVLGNPAWAQEPRFATRKGRIESAQELDRLVESWTVQRLPEEVMASLQGAGVAAGVVQDCEDLLEKDPQLRFRRAFVELHHREQGYYRHLGWPTRFSFTPPRYRPAPCIGEHTEYVCREFLGMSDQEFINLWNAGAFGRMGETTPGPSHPQI